ncbi:cytochrome c oxidase subunit 6A1, mitochondrial [Galendromus occidentalis]|uniref:Cytochrome c oxidase subunit 6A1, mitochondrial n=1 Tax=Galendromus occidentalis TaxID=34638 RepID=A0AAJ6VZ50_9ACAR|nr:cytochrome c oxidase subunit 6A1, mitochondrial [Galendromus occidentalis]
MASILGRVARRFASTAVKDHQDHEAAALLWKRLSLFVALPAVVIVGINTYLHELEHHKHEQRPEFIPCEHLGIINKPFPWGDGKHGLLFNKKVNFTRDGYED